MRKHLKRLRVPGFWNVPRKANKWVTRPRPGAHRLLESIPLAVVLRDVLKAAATGGEAKTIVKSRSVNAATEFMVGGLNVGSVTPKCARVNASASRHLNFGADAGLMIGPTWYWSVISSMPVLV